MSDCSSEARPDRYRPPPESTSSTRAQVLGATRHLIELASDQRHATDTVLLAATRTAIDHILPLRLGSPELARITIQVDELETRRVAERSSR
ncbi:MAG: hypothetical protein R2710_12510 [Acidimicrobiales bacterium]